MTTIASQRMLLELRARYSIVTWFFTIFAIMRRKVRKLTKGEKQWKGAEEQIKRYAAAPRVEALRQGTQLHKIIMQFEGWKLRKMDEVE